MPAQTVPYYVQTLPGFEPISWLEIRSRLNRAAHKGQAFAEEKNGIVFFDYRGTPADTLTLRTVEDVFVLAVRHMGLSHDYRDLRTITRELSEGPAIDAALNAWVDAGGSPPPVSVRIVSRKTGDHAYRRLDVENAARKALSERYGAALRWVPEGADLEIWVNVLGPLLLIGLRLSDRTMRHRNYKAEHLPASLRPSAAAAMVLLSEPKPEDAFLDPTCGAGTLLAERLASGPARLVLGGDISAEALRAARANVRVPLLRWDAGRLPVAPQSIDAIACNPPFGKKIGSRQSVQALYPRLLAETLRVLKPGGRAVFVTSEYDAMRDALRTVHGLTLDRGYSVALLGEWGRIYILRR